MKINYKNIADFSFDEIYFNRKIHYQNTLIAFILKLIDMQKYGNGCNVSFDLHSRKQNNHIIIPNPYGSCYLSFYSYNVILLIWAHGGKTVSSLSHGIKIIIELFIR